METSEKAKRLIELAKRIVSEELAIGVQMEYHELLAVVTVLEANHLLEDFIKQFNGLVRDCPCNGTHCPGKLVIDDQNNLLAIPTIVEQAKVKGLLPSEYIKSLISQNEIDQQMALEFAEACLKGDKAREMKLSQTASRGAMEIAEQLAHVLAELNDPFDSGGLVQ